MSFWDDVTEKVSAGSRVVADKAKEVSEIANIRAQIVSCDNTLVKNYKALGKAYFEAHKDDASGEFADVMKNIKDAADKKNALSDLLKARKNCADDAKCDCTDKAADVVTDIAEGANDVVDAVKETAEDIIN